MATAPAGSHAANRTTNQWVRDIPVCTERTAVVDVPQRRLRGTVAAPSYRFLTAAFAGAAVFGALVTFVAGRLAGEVAAGALVGAVLEAEAAEAFLVGAAFAGALAAGGHTPLASLGAA